tara:strand:+ start:577 stop:1125 length:549 start_codon:yes stop_codon:yes gene_type:complete
MIQFYKPNPKVTGNACSFFLTADGSIMASMIKQDSWSNGKASFSKNKGVPSKSVMTKLSRIEVAGIIDAIETNREWTAYHQSQKQVVQMKFCPYMRSGDQVGFSFSINKQDREDSTNKSSYIIGLYFPEARLLKHDLEAFLDKTATIMTQNAPEPQQKSPIKQIDLDEDKPSGNPFDDEDIF